MISFPNMALVHRKMANLTICNELNKPILKGPTDHYKCVYNGVGSVGSSIGNTYYDQGGDLLVDRFEMGCRWTRGDGNVTASSKSIFGQPDNKTNFTNT